MRSAQLAGGFEGSAFVNTLFMPSGVHPLPPPVMPPQ